MKLSEMTTDQLADCLLVIAEPIANIAQDEAVISAFRELGNKSKNKEPVISLVGEFAKTVMPLALKQHRQDIYTVLSTLSGKTIDQIKQQKACETIKDMQDIWDKELIDFFSLQKASVQKE